MLGGLNAKWVWAWSLSLLAHTFIIANFIWEWPQPSSEETLQFSVVEQTATKVSTSRISSQVSKTKAQSKSRQPSRKKSKESSTAFARTETSQALSFQKASQKLDLKIVYPSISLRRREEGQAVYQLRFSSDLRLVAYEKLKSSGFLRLDASVEAALARNLIEEPGNPKFEERLIIDFRLRGKRADIRFD